MSGQVAKPLRPTRRTIRAPGRADVCRIDQGNEDVDVQQVHGHGSSSRNWFTSSGVTGCAAAAGQQWHAVALLVPSAARASSLCCASVEMTSPTLFAIALGEMLGGSKDVVVDGEGSA